MIELSAIVVSADPIPILLKHLEELFLVLERSGYEYEVLVILGGQSANFSDLHLLEIKQNVFFICELKRGIYHAMNCGISASRGNFLYFSNIGDTPIEFPNNLDSNFIVNAFPVRILSKEGVYISERSPFDRRYLVPPHQGMFVRGDWIRLNPFDTSFKIVSDFEMSVRIGFQNMCFHSEPPVSYFRLGGVSGSKTFKSLCRRKFERFRVILRYRHFFPWLRFVLFRVFHLYQVGD